MKLGNLTDRGHNREPLYTLPQIAERLGIPHKTLMAELRKARWRNMPKAVGVGFPNKHLRLKYYRLSEFKVWFTEREA